MPPLPHPNQPDANGSAVVTFKGFSSPIKAYPKVATVKANKWIALKFRLKTGFESWMDPGSPVLSPPFDCKLGVPPADPFNSSLMLTIR